MFQNTTSHWVWVRQALYRTQQREIHRKSKAQHNDPVLLSAPFPVSQREETHVYARALSLSYSAAPAHRRPCFPMLCNSVHKTFFHPSSSSLCFSQPYYPHSNVTTSSARNMHFLRIASALFTRMKFRFANLLMYTSSTLTLKKQRAFPPNLHFTSHSSSRSRVSYVSTYYTFLYLYLSSSYSFGNISEEENFCYTNSHHLRNSHRQITILKIHSTDNFIRIGVRCGKMTCRVIVLIKTIQYRAYVRCGACLHTTHIYK